MAARFHVVVAVALLALVLGYARSYSSTELNTLLVQYNISPSLIASLKPVYMNFSGTEYVVLYNGTTPYFVVNTSSDSFVLNATSIYDIIRNYTINSALSQINFSKLGVQMHEYQDSSAGPINDCLQETGLNTGLTCTLSNYCNSCQVVPVCKDVLDNTSGPSGVLGLGIMKFESQYNALNASYSSFYSLLNGINKTNVLERVAGLESAFYNISKVSSALYQNPIFPPENVTPNMIATCINYPNPANAPWYCTALGFCEALTYNGTLLSKMRAEFNAINSSAISNSAVFALAQKTGSIQLGYIYPTLSRQRLALLQRTVNTVLGNYSTVVNGAESLLSHVNNSTVLNDLVLLEKSYASLQSNYLSENISSAVNSTAVLLRNLSSIYGKLNSTYYSILGLASNNTAKLLEAQLTNPQQAGLESLAFAEMGINSKLGSGNLSSLYALRSSLLNISAMLSHYSTSSIGLAEIARSVDGAFARPLAYGLHLPYSSAIASMPALAALLSIIIGILVLLVLVFIRSYLSIKKKLVVNKRTARNWHMLMELVAIIILAYVVATYALAAYANAHAPFSAFASAVKGSKYIIIAVNGTPTLNLYSCASSIGAKASALGKDPVLISISNGVCKVGNSTMSYNSCMNYYAALNTPVMLLSNGTSGMSLYSFYGTLLSYSGNASVMNACYPALLLN
ncbi:MAG: hypothetical protein ACP5T3_01415 [Candidatus Micrarchaeia archaeon]